MHPALSSVALIWKAPARRLGERQRKALRSTALRPNARVPPRPGVLARWRVSTKSLADISQAIRGRRALAIRAGEPTGRNLSARPLRVCRNGAESRGGVVRRSGLRLAIPRFTRLKLADETEHGRVCRLGRGGREVSSTSCHTAHRPGDREPQRVLKVTFTRERRFGLSGLRPSRLGVPLLSMSASAQRYGGPEYGDTRGGPEYRERDYRSREGGYGNRSAAKPSTLTHTKSLIVGGARRHLPAHDRLENVGITAQVLAFIEPILTTPGPSAPFSSLVIALSVVSVPRCASSAA